MSLVHAPARVEPVSEVQITAQNENKQLSIRGYPKQRPMVCLHVCRELTNIYGKAIAQRRRSMDLVILSFSD